MEWDLKIENFLLDENNNIKIVDFGLSNTVKSEGLSQELLNTQCGSPAYAAPELLAHKTYGPKVDVWSMGVSMFAMLTGTLPFTVEPFNIKQLHQKMINGEISPIPPDISTGAVQFMRLLLEPDPAKRPTVKEAMEEKWLNEGLIRRPLNSVTYKNRLRPDELNPVVLNYMTETMELTISEIINVLINNRPSSVMASYCLLLKKLLKYQKDTKFLKKRDPDEWNSATKAFLLDLEEGGVSVKRPPTQMKTIVEKHESPPPQCKKEEEDTRKIEQQAPEIRTNTDKEEDFPSTQNPVFEEADPEYAIPLNLENQEKFAEVSKFAGREFIHLEPPKSTERNLLATPTHQAPLDEHEHLDGNNDQVYVKKSDSQDKEKSIFVVKPTLSANQPTQKSVASCPGKGEKKSLARNSYVPEEGTRFKDLLKAVDDNMLIPTWRYQDKEGPSLAIAEPPQLSPLPRLRQTALRDNITKRVPWVGMPQHSTSGIPLVLPPGTRPPIFPMSRQQTLMVRSLRQSKEKQRISFSNNIRIKRNMVQLKHTHKSVDLNLPLLSPPFQSKSDKKN